MLELVALVAMVPFLAIELVSLQDFGWSWLIFQNVVDALTYIVQVRLF